jgi:hypothetical protein
VPENDVITFFDELMDNQFYIDNLDELRDFLHYFEDTWIGRPGQRGGTTASICPIALWNVHAQVIDDLHAQTTPSKGGTEGFLSY